MEKNNQNIFQNDAADKNSVQYIVNDILARYNLKESDEILAQKLLLGNTASYSNGGTIFWVAEQLNENKKTTEEATSLLSEKINIDKKIAEQIVEEAKKILLPVLKQNLSEKNAIPAPISPKLGSTLEARTGPAQKTDLGKKEKKIPPTGRAKEISQQNNNSSSKNDTYREPIE